MTRRAAFPIALAALLCAGSAAYADTGAATDPDYRRVVERTTGMVTDEHVRELAASRGLDVLDLTWEDTGRFENSSVGPNISDMTIQVQTCDEQGDESCQLHLMPVIRHPNFADKTGDVPADRFFVRVGNEQRSPGSLKSVPLTDVLIPNETEFVALVNRLKLAGKKPLTEAALAALSPEKLHRLCRAFRVPTLIVTLGARGCFVSQATGFTALPACTGIKVIDTTGAGDAFCGGFAAGLVKFSGDTVAAARFANAVAALSVTKIGTAPAMPAAREISRFLRRQRHA